jgi:hypothetical protein
VRDEEREENSARHERRSRTVPTAWWSPEQSTASAAKGKLGATATGVPTMPRRSSGRRRRRSEVETLRHEATLRAATFVGDVKNRADEAAHSSTS